MGSLNCSGQLDRSWLVPFRARQVQRQNPIVEFRLGFIGVDFDRDGDCAIEATRQSLAPTSAPRREW